MLGLQLGISLTIIAIISIETYFFIKQDKLTESAMEISKADSFKQ